MTVTPRRYYCKVRLHAILVSCSGMLPYMAGETYRIGYGDPRSFRVTLNSLCTFEPGEASKEDRQKVWGSADDCHLDLTFDGPNDDANIHFTVTSDLAVVPPTRYLMELSSLVGYTIDAEIGMTGPDVESYIFTAGFYKGEMQNVKTYVFEKRDDVVVPKELVWLKDDLKKAKDKINRK